MRHLVLLILLAFAGCAATDERRQAAEISRQFAIALRDGERARLAAISTAEFASDLAAHELSPVQFRQSLAFTDTTPEVRVGRRVADTRSVLVVASVDAEGVVWGVRVMLRISPEIRVSGYEFSPHVQEEGSSR